MKGLGKHILKLTILVAAINLIAAILFRFILMPSLIPQDVPVEKLSTFLNITGVGFFIVGLLTSAFLLLLAYRLMAGTNLYQEILDSINRPLMILDESKRYVIINREAERVLDLSRERDVGKVLLPEVESCLRDNRSGGDIMRDGIVLKGVGYIPCEHALPPAVNPDGTRTILILDNVGELLAFRKTLYKVGHDLAIIGASTKRVTDASQSLFTGTTRQAGSLSAISSSLDQFSQRIEGNTEAATNGTRVAAQAREAAERSGNEIANALSAMNDVQDAGVRIARIVKLIDDIAFQTNLLALNAAVEAARAGRQGKGFAVVADEVRNLAGRSAKAAKDTAVMVEDVTERIGNASAYISRLEDMLRNIMQDAVRMADSSAAASELSVQQASAIFQVNRELGEMNNLTQSTKSEAARTVSAVHDLAKLVGDFKKRFANIPLPDQAAEEIGDADIFERVLGDDSDYSDYPDYAEDDRSAGRDLDNYNYNATATKYDAVNADSDAANGYMWDDDIDDFDADADPNDIIPLPVPPDSEEDFGSTLHTDDDDDRAAPFKRMAALRKLQDDLASFDESHSPSDGPLEFSTNEDGDRVVNPNQNIQLDDNEFGRY